MGHKDASPSSRFPEDSHQAVTHPETARQVIDLLKLVGVASKEDIGRSPSAVLALGVGEGLAEMELLSRLGYSPPECCFIDKQYPEGTLNKMQERGFICITTDMLDYLPTVREGTISLIVAFGIEYVLAAHVQFFAIQFSRILATNSIVIVPHLSDTVPKVFSQHGLQAVPADMPNPYIFKKDAK